MAYLPVAQTEQNGAYDESQSTNTPSQVDLRIYNPRDSLNFDQTSPKPANRDSDPFNDDGLAKVGSLFKKLGGSHPYQVVEDDEYEVQDLDHHTSQHNKLTVRNPVMDTEVIPDDSLVRTASVSRNLPLNHPTPDLQSLQGAYRKNVERLEETAESFSFTSSLEEEMQRMKNDHHGQRRQFSNTDSNPSRNTFPVRHPSATSLPSRDVYTKDRKISGRQSASGYITSPTSSIRSDAWSHQQHLDQAFTRVNRLGSPFPLTEEEELQIQPEHNSPTNGHWPSALDDPAEFSTVTKEYDLEDRPPTSASNETNRQANEFFSDFDGVHYRGSIRRPQEQRDSFGRRISLAQPPLARDSKVYKEAQPGEKMIYYPAPVPVMLNLPQRLSVVNLTDREKRRQKALSNIPNDMRKSAAWLGQAAESTELAPKGLNVPPQLRASAFFDLASNTPNVELKDGSAVDTLDSILDAAAFAPVSAFTDHPIAGHLGKEVYGSSGRPRKTPQAEVQVKKNRRSSLSNILKLKNSNSALSDAKHNRLTSRESKALEQEEHSSEDEDDWLAADSIAPGEDEQIEGEQGENEADRDAESDEDHNQSGFLGAPTTLLAELQLRKDQQKQRNRTAADRFPKGMHSTLLELDAVTQLQQKSRKQKHVTLAWEDHDAADRENFDDEDVPLGVLFPEKEHATHNNVNRPVGLMEKRDMEDNEPLSYRQARLKGKPISASQPPESLRLVQAEDDNNTVKDVEPPPQLSDPVLQEHEGETLAQRMKRMKEEKSKSMGGDFAQDISTELGLKREDDKPDISKTPEIEETLGQRRKRLQEEAHHANGQSQPQLQPRRSLADILQAHPVGVPRQVSNESKYTIPGQITRSTAIGVNHMFNQQTASIYNTPGIFPYQHNFYANPMNNMYGSNQNLVMPLGMNNVQYGYGSNMYLGYVADPSMGPPLDPKQRAVIDQWRQDIA